MSVFQGHIHLIILRLAFRNKAVSDGAISFYLDHFVRTRVTKLTYGNFCHIPYDPADSDHKSRSQKVFTSVSGNKRISDSFDVILAKVSVVSSFFLSAIKKKIVEYSSFGDERI